MTCFTRRLPLLISALMAGATFSHPVPAGAAAASPVVRIISTDICGTAKGFCFSPASTTVLGGSSVTWANATGVAHTATDDGGAWDTGTVNPGQQSSTVTFGKIGSFSYHCQFHKDMRGTVVVTGPGPGQYYSLAPSRLLDTRSSGQTLTAGSSLTLPVGLLVPNNATAVVLNVTVTNTNSAGFLTVYPTGGSRPTASSLNWAAGDTRPNMVVVPLWASGSVTLFASRSADVVADLEGYFAPPSGSAGGYVPLAPARLLDTRTAGTALGPGGTIDLPINGAGGVPSTGVSAVVLNVTVTNTSAAGYLTAYPTGTARPAASNLNWARGWTVPNRVIVPLGTDGKVTFFNYAGSTDLVVDVNGYFTDATATGTLFTPVGPVRIMDTREWARTLSPGYALPVQVVGSPGAGVPNSATAAILNVTATNTTAPGFLTVYPGGVQPTASDLNFVAGQTIPNLVVATLSPNGTVMIYNYSGTTDVVVDLVGWFG